MDYSRIQGQEYSQEQAWGIHIRIHKYANTILIHIGFLTLDFLTQEPRRMPEQRHVWNSLAFLHFCCICISLLLTSTGHLAGEI